MPKKKKKFLDYFEDESQIDEVEDWLLRLFTRLVALLRNKIKHVYSPDVDKYFESKIKVW